MERSHNMENPDDCSALLGFLPIPGYSPPIHS